MLTDQEKAFFLIAALISLTLTLRGLNRIRRVIRRGTGSLARENLGARLAAALHDTFTLRRVFRSRAQTSRMHALVAWCFLFYLLVNVGDLLRGFIPQLTFLSEGTATGPYRLLADLLSAGALVGISALLARRFVRKAQELEVSSKARLHPKARNGIRRDSAIVGVFILLHVGARFLGESFETASTGFDVWRPLSSGVGVLWTGTGTDTLLVARHTTWWLSLGLILVFLPYLPYSKHIHVLFAPLNYLLKPKRHAPGEMTPLSLDAATYGASRLEDLSRPQLMDAYACVQCNRCQEVCPASLAGSALSPAALEINKRYQLNGELIPLAAGKPSQKPLTEFALTEEAVWACTSCGACADICPVGNEPLRDILDIRQHLTLEEGRVPERGADMLRSLAVLSNPWGRPPSQRMAWAQGLNVRVMRDVGKADVLYWVGCSAAYDGRNQNIVRAVVQLLEKAGVDFAVLGDEESCTGDPARRMGDEALFQQQAQRNLQILSRYTFARIVTHCSHCFHVLKNEYPRLLASASHSSLQELGEGAAVKANWEVAHHTQFLSELLAAGRLKPHRALDQVVTFHDSCYLGRYNGEYDAPRALLTAIPGVELKEMPRSRAKGLCCGGGGGCAWVDMPAERRVTDIRLEEALSVQPGVIASACPFCLTMFEGSAQARAANVPLKDVAELLNDSTEGSA